MTANQIHRCFVQAANWAVTDAKKGDRSSARAFGQIARNWWNLYIQAARS